MRINGHRVDSWLSYAMVTLSSPVNSQATTVHTYPGLPPVVEASPEAEDP